MKAFGRRALSDMGVGCKTVGNGMGREGEGTTYQQKYERAKSVG